MSDIEIWELKFKANVAINTQYTDEETVAIHDAIVRAINEHAKNRLLLGETALTIVEKAKQ